METPGASEQVTCMVELFGENINSHSRIHFSLSHVIGNIGGSYERIRSVYGTITYRYYDRNLDTASLSVEHGNRPQIILKCDKPKEFTEQLNSCLQLISKKAEDAAAEDAAA